MKKIDMEKEEKLSMTRELKFKELQDKIDEEEADKIVEEAIKKSKRKASTKNVTTELEQEIDQLLEVETKKRGRKAKKVEVDNIEEELSDLLDEKKKEEVKKETKQVEEKEDVKITKVNTEDDLYLTSSFKPLKTRMKASKIIKFIIKMIFLFAVLGAFVYFVLLPLYKMLEDSKPKAIFDNTLDYVQEQAYAFIDTNIPIDSNDFSVEAILDLDSNIKGMESYVNNDFVFTFGYKEKDNAYENGYYVQNKENVRHGNTFIIKDKFAYTKYTTSDNFIKQGMIEEDIELNDTAVVSTDDYKYYINKLISVMKESIKEEDIEATKEELLIDGISVNVVRNSLELNKDEAIKLEKEMYAKLLKDEKFLKIEAAMFESTLEEVKKTYEEEPTYDDDYVISYNIYTTKGTKFVGFDIEEKGFRNFYFYKYENKFEAHMNLSEDSECSTGGDCVENARTVIDLIGTTKNNQTKVDVFYNDEDIGSLEVTEFNLNKIDFDYNIILGDIRYQGDVLYEFNKDKKEYEFSFALEFDDEYLRLSFKFAYDVLDNIGYIDDTKVIDYTEKVELQEETNLYKELSKLDMDDAFEIYEEIVDMIFISTEDEEVESTI
ncbi:MAG: hypothetical protein E7171_00245 [Firmicutes bacterium]|nr:hypothetical protein [Bacillota bacterium]